MAAPVLLSLIEKIGIVVLVTVIVLLISIRRGRSWAGRRFRELDHLEEYFPLLFTRWQTALWGGSILAVAFSWHFVTSDWPPYIKLIAVFVALFFAGYYVWRADHVLLQQKIEVKIRKHSWSVETGGQGWQYFLEISNKSEATTIHGVQVQLREMVPDNRDWLPVTLHQQHDSPRHDGTFLDSFDLNPAAPKNVDLFTAITNGSSFQISHIVAHSPLIISFFPKHRLHVVISGEHIKPLSVWLEVWIDEERIPQCEIMEKGDLADGRPSRSA